MHEPFWALWVRASPRSGGDGRPAGQAAPPDDPRAVADRSP